MDRWVKAAMADDSMVVELLLLLRKKSTSSSSTPTSSALVHCTQLKWGVRQPRSTPSSLRFSSSGGRKRKVVSSAPVAGGIGGGSCGKMCFRGSPTTPLSWSGGPTSASTPSPSATADFINEASSLPSSRSKGSGVGMDPPLVVFKTTGSAAARWSEVQAAISKR